MVSIQALREALHNLLELYRVDRKVPVTHFKKVFHNIDSETLENSSGHGIIDTVS